jgi:hypothetical protein
MDHYEDFGEEEEQPFQKNNTNLIQEAREYNNSLKNPPPQSRRPTRREKERVEIASSVFAVLQKPSLIDDDLSDYMPRKASMNVPKPITPPVPPRRTTEQILQEVKAPPVEKKVIHREGYLRKQGKKFKTWKKRYFILHQKKLQYYTERNGSLIGTIELTDACTVTLNLDKKGMVELHVPGRVWLMIAEDEKSQDDWRAAIQDALWQN